MYLTNNKKTIYNLILYSDFTHTKRNLTFTNKNSWNKAYYRNKKPYGNKGLVVQIYYGGKIPNQLNNIKE